MLYELNRQNDMKKESIGKFLGREFLVSRESHIDDTVITVGEHHIGEGFSIIAGPCSVENEEQIFSLAKIMKSKGADFLRGGAYKPRTSPYDFQGLGEKGIKMLTEAGRNAGLPVVSEILDPRDLEIFKDVDILQVGARNMQNFPLLRAVGKSKKPVLLKRGQGSDIREFLLSAEYIMAEGNPNIILCERGIKTFETVTRSTLDLSSIPVLKKLTHLPIIVDPSHATGYSELVEPMALAAAACGADGVMIEVHTNPKLALCDGEQAQNPEEFEETVIKIKKINRALFE